MNDGPDLWVERILDGQTRAAARMISAIERGAPGLGPHLARLWRAGGRARVIGLTGPPGAGKSTLVHRLIRDARARGERVAVLAVDPSSPRSGGAILGDRVRMQSMAEDEGVFIRSMSARGAFGGLAHAAGNALTVLDALGVETILLETVGVGQTEVEIAAFCPCVLLLQTAAGGDGVQAIKAGIMEIASAFVVTKPGIIDPREALRFLREAGARRHAADPEGWIPPALAADALTGAGMDDLHQAIDARFGWLAAHPETAAREEEARIRERALLVLRARAERAMTTQAGDAGIADLLAAVRRRETDITALTDRLMRA